MKGCAVHDNIELTIKENTGLIFKQLHKFHLVDDPEAESIGYEALYNAALTYESTKKAKFSTYATVCIYNGLGTYTRTLNRQRQLDVISYNNKVSNGSYEAEYSNFITNGVSTEDCCIKEELCATALRTFDELLNKLTNEKHKKIIIAWQESDYSGSTVELAINVGVSQPYVSQVLTRFKSDMKTKLKEYYND